MPQTNSTPKRGFINTLPYDEIMSASGIEHQVALTQEQIKALAALVEYQRWGTRWHNVEAFDKDAVDAFIDDTIDRLFQELETPDICEDGSCIEIGAFHPALTYYPNNPKTQPEHEGGYESPVWITGAGFPGATVNDAMIDPVAFIGQDTLALLQSGLLPSVTLEFTGDGEIDIQFLQTIQGGAAWVYPDGNILAGDLVNLQYADILDLAGTITVAQFFEIVLQADTEAFTITHSVKFETSGDHTLTMVFFPTVEIGPPFFGIGGGLRSIQLCGDATVDEATEMAHTLEIEQDGTLKLLADGIPVSTVDLKSLLDDDYVNVEGDTMTGTLIHDVAAGTVKQQQQFYYNGVEKARVTNEANTLSYLGLDGHRLAWRVLGTNEAALQMQANRLTMRAGDGVAVTTGHIRLRGGDVQALMAGRVNGVNHYEGYDRDNILRLALSELDGVLGAAFAGWDYSSTNTWRKQFDISGDWVSSVDATRKGAMMLHVSGYDGDYEIMRAEYGDDIMSYPLLSFFAKSPGNSPRTMVYHEQVSARLDELATELQAYGLIGDYIMPTQPVNVPEETTDFTRCFAAYYVADQLAVAIEALFDDMQTISTVEFLNNVASQFGLVDPYEQNIVYSAFQAGYAERTGIVDEITDRAVLAEALIADFSLEGILSFVDGYAWALNETPVLLTDLLTQIWERQVWVWAGQGIVAEYGPCAEGGNAVLACTDATYDLRWLAMHGLDLVLGTQVLAQGVHNEFDGVNDYRVDILGYYDACTFNTIRVHAVIAETAQRPHLYLWQGPPGALTDQIITVGPEWTGTGVQVWEVANLAQHGAHDAWQVRLESEPNDNNNYITKIDVIID